jgi:hypothetical protein
VINCFFLIKNNRITVSDYPKKNAGGNFENNTVRKIIAEIYISIAKTQVSFIAVKESNLNFFGFS